MAGFLLAQHRVRNFSEWYKGYVSGRTPRTEAGLTEIKVFRNHADPDHITMLFSVENLAKAKALIESPALKEHMESIGVLGPMSVTFLKEAP